MTAWWRCRRLATQLPLFHPVQVVVALVSWGRVLLFRPSQPLGLASATVYLFAAVLALHVAAVLLLLKGTRIARDHTMWRRNAQLGRRQVQVSLVRVRWRLAAAAAVEGLLGVLFSFWSVAMGLGLAGADAAGTSSMLLLAWAPVGALSHLGMLFPLCFLLWRLRNALAWTRCPSPPQQVMWACVRVKKNLPEREAI